MKRRLPRWPNHKRRNPRKLALAGLLFAVLAYVGPGAIAQTTGSDPEGQSSNAPVTFLADTVGYDKTNNVVTAAGHVRAWQGSQTLYADKVVLDRNTDVVTAYGHIILTEPGGESVYANSAVLSKGMKNAVLHGVAARAGPERPHGRQWRQTLQCRY